jgi:DNA-3-methyladenine glycosylase II
MHRKAINHLRKVDPDLAAIIARVGPCRLEQRTDGTHFGYVLRSIVYQQLSGAAAATIFGRVAALYGDRHPTPAELLATEDAILRAAGLSSRKVEYAKELAARTHSGELAIERLHELGDDDVMATLIQVRGIGRWTAQMVLMFRLGRPDVLPELDLGVQKAVQQMLRMRKLPTPEKLTKIGAKWAPYRTVASWYLWRSLEVPA